MASFEISEAEELQAYIDRGLEQGVKNGLLSIGMRIVQSIQTEIIPAEKPAPIFDSHYAQAWQVEPTPQGAVVFNDMPYAGVIEDGARAENIKIGRKMIDALAEWARRKGVTGRAPADRAAPGAHIEARQVAWAIARKMQGVPGKSDGTGIFNRDGHQGLGILRKALAKVPGYAEQEMQREIKRAMRK